LPIAIKRNLIFSRGCFPIQSALIRQGCVTVCVVSARRLFYAVGEITKLLRNMYMVLQIQENSFNNARTLCEAPQPISFTPLFKAARSFMRRRFQRCTTYSLPVKSIGQPRLQYECTKKLACRLIHSGFDVLLWLPTRPTSSLNGTTV